MLAVLILRDTLNHVEKTSLTDFDIPSADIATSPSREL